MLMNRKYSRYGAILAGAWILSSCALFQSGAKLEGPQGLQPSKKPEPKLSCLTKPADKHRSPEVQKAYDRMKTFLNQNNSKITPFIWDQGQLAKQAQLKDSLGKYLQGSKGASLKKISLEGRSLTEIHQQLLKLGFRHFQIPLQVFGKPNATTYWFRDGSQSSVIKVKSDLLPFHIYVHDDGSLVRLKPAGIPDPKRKNPRPQPHGSKSVLLNLKKICKDSQCELDTSFDNEGFKVTESGLPVPKAPIQRFGLRSAPNQFQKGNSADTGSIEEAWKDAVMDLIHIDLKADFSHCQ